MKKYRVNTTISQKHHEILKKYAEKYGTQQSTLEHALEGLERNSNEGLGLPPEEEELWMRIGREIKDVFTLLQRDITKQLFDTADLERFQEYTRNEKPAEFAIEWYYNKPLKECTLQEIMDALIIKVKIQGGTDNVTLNEETDYYTLNIAHSLGVNCSKIFIIMYESVFESYGAKYEAHFSERNVFFKVYK
ncbi:MAG: hypothetical protein A4E25_02427 [Methanobacterium sp. PtaB.Bin024]|jgi:hypothetical protein|nr:MAG: hypothetical protein A4E25_02427 [Methanobacterium sp. PtaB.Bin024]